MLVDLTTYVSQDSPLLQWAKQQDNPHIAMGHIGTHLDTYEKRPTPLDYLRSPGVIFDVRGITEVAVEHINLDEVEPQSFVLFRTGCMEQHPYGEPGYFERHPQLSHSLIQALVEKGVRFVGVDCPGIRRHEEHEAADRLCERHGVYVIENLANLGQLPRRGLTVYTMWLDDPVMTALKCKVVAEYSGEGAADANGSLCKQTEG